MAKKPKRTATSGEIDLGRSRLRYQLVGKIVDGFYGVVRSGLKYSAWIACAYLAVQAIRQVAGQTTNVTFQAALTGFFEEGKDRVVWAFVAAVALVAYTLERRLRLRIVRELSARPRQLEELIDPGRSTSKLKLTGQPRKEDKEDA